jgi:hypothetical protein
MRRSHHATKSEQKERTAHGTDRVVFKTAAVFVKFRLLLLLLDLFHGPYGGGTSRGPFTFGGAGSSGLDHGGAIVTLLFAQSLFQRRRFAIFKGGHFTE